MRIAYVINSVEGGGAAAPVPAVASVLRDHGAAVAVFALTGRNRRGLPPMQAAGLDVRVRPDGEKDHLAAYRWLRGEMRAWRPDVIWTSLTRATLLGQMAGRAMGVPVVSWQHNAYLKTANRLLLRARRNASALWIADSHCVAALTEARLGIPPERLMTWPLFAADAAAPRAAPWRAGEPVRIGTLGRLHRAKGYDVLIEALASLPPDVPPLELAIGGEGAERTTLEQAINARGLGNVRLAGFMDDPRGFLAGLHLYVQPSRREGLCIAVHEAMQAGLPVVASAVGEMPYSVVEGETGLIVPPEDPLPLAAALGRMLRQPELLAEMGAKARARMLDRFGAERFAAAGGAIMARLAGLV